jgi:gluconolactonase
MGTGSVVRLRALVGSTPRIERLASGFRFTEGPVWHPVDRELQFSDIPADTRWRWTERDGASVAQTPTNKANGMTYDADLRLVVCEHSTNSVARLGAGGTRTVLATEFDGAELNSPNDVVVARDGSIIFTDPTYGRNDEFGRARPLPRETRGVYRLPPAGTLELLRDDFDQPNGLCLSPDGLRLYVNDSTRAHIRVFDIGPEWSLDAGVVFAEQIGDGIFGEGIVDGMKCDASGNVWVTGPDGLWVFDPGGVHLGVVAIPEEVGNFHWGGPDWQWLFVCASTSLYRFQTDVPPSSEPFMEVASP